MSLATYCLLVSMRAISSDLSRRVPEALVEHVVDLSVVAVAEPEVRSRSVIWRQLASWFRELETAELSLMHVKKP